MPQLTQEAPYQATPAPKQASKPTTAAKDTPAPATAAEEPIVASESPTQAADVPAAAAPSEPAPPINVPGLDAMANREIFEAARRENVQRDFVHDVLAARNHVEPVYVPPPVPEFIANQTKQEMEAGRKAVEARALEDAKRPRRPVENEGTSTPVFRPNDYVPDPKKSQGHVQARTMSA